MILKIGGSLVSDKAASDNIDHAAVAAYARQVADLARSRPGRMALVVGGGSIGHGAVRELDPCDPFAALVLTRATFDVKWIWTRELRRLGIRALPLQLAAACVLSRGRPVFADTAVTRLLEVGGLPVLSGDSLLDDSGRLQVFGSDWVTGVMLQHSAGPLRIAALTDVPGVLRGGPSGAETIADLSPDDLGIARRHLWDSGAWETSGAMGGKLDALATWARQGAECFILRGDPDAGDLDFLFRPRDEWPAGLPHTRIAPAQAADPAAAPQEIR
nr:hypothetical protein [Streptomonospora sp. PA3]